MLKKPALIAGVVVLLALAGGFLFLKSRRPAEPGGLPEPEGKLIETPLEERPFVTLTPRADGHELKLVIKNIQNAQTIDYELVYLSNGLSRGVIGEIKLKGEKEVSRDLLLGSCSRDICKYDENVTEGTLTLRFRSSEGVRKFATDFHLQQGDDALTAVEGQFTLEADLPASFYYLTMSTIGLPASPASEVLVGPYGVFTPGSEVAKKGTVSITLSEETDTAKLYAWNGKEWEELEAEIEGQTLSAPVDTLTTFLVTASE